MTEELLTCKAAIFLNKVLTLITKVTVKKGFASYDVSVKVNSDQRFETRVGNFRTYCV